MAVISISITEASLQKVAGIPTTVELTTNVPATIFYTLDGTTPTVASSVVTGPIELPTDSNTVTLTVFATDGVDTSAVVSWTFGTTTVGDRQPRDTVSGLDLNSHKATFPFGTSNAGEPGIYGNTGGITVDAAGTTTIPTGFDADGNPTGGTDLEYNLQNYDIVFSETNNLGQMGRGIGTLPANATVIIPPSQQSPPGSSNTNSPVFNPKALVIFQDSTEPPYDADVPQIMRSNFDLIDPETARYGAMLFTTALEGNVGRGSALKQQFNPRDNTITYYYRDAETNRWIISKTKFVPKDQNIFNLSRVVVGTRNPGDQYVYKWIPFQYRRLI